jgi:hypothetical protein
MLMIVMIMLKYYLFFIAFIYLLFSHSLLIIYCITHFSYILAHLYYHYCYFYFVFHIRLLNCPIFKYLFTIFNTMLCNALLVYLFVRFEIYVHYSFYNGLLIIFSNIFFDDGDFGGIEGVNFCIFIYLRLENYV